MKHLGYAEANLRRIVESLEFKQYAQGNPYAEVEFAHALSVSYLSRELWLRRFGKKPPLALKISGLFHDCDRFFPKERVDTSKTSAEEYEAKKLEHSKNCSRIFQRENPGLPVVLRDDVAYMIERHEIGGDKINGRLVEVSDKFTSSFNLNVSSDILQDCDGMDFFFTILPKYVEWPSPERVREKIKFSYNKLSPIGQQMVRERKYNDDKIREIIMSTIDKN